MCVSVSQVRAVAWCSFFGVTVVRVRRSFVSRFEKKREGVFCFLGSADAVQLDAASQSIRRTITTTKHS